MKNFDLILLGLDPKEVEAAKKTALKDIKDDKKVCKRKEKCKKK